MGGGQEDGDTCDMGQHKTWGHCHDEDTWPPVLCRAIHRYKPFVGHGIRFSRIWATEIISFGHERIHEYVPEPWN